MHVRVGAFYFGVNAMCGEQGALWVWMIWEFMGMKAEWICSIAMGLQNWIVFNLNWLIRISILCFNDEYTDYNVPKSVTFILVILYCCGNSVCHSLFGTFFCNSAAHYWLYYELTAHKIWYWNLKIFITRLDKIVISLHFMYSNPLIEQFYNVQINFIINYLNT